MKQVKTLLIAVTMFIAGNQVINAQSKTAHVEVGEIMAKMPAMLEAQKQLEKLSGTYDTEYKSMVEEYQNKLKKYEARSYNSVTDAVNETRQKKYKTCKKELLTIETMLKKNYNKKNQKLLNLYMEKVKASIVKVGKAKGFQYVLNSEGSCLLADGPNLTADVKKDLGF
jgi:outer membrane protein